MRRNNNADKEKNSVAGQKKLEYELQRESSLINQAGFMTAAFSFSTTALFSAWQIGLEHVDTVPNGVVHICVGLISIFLLLCILFSVKALLQSKTIRISLEKKGSVSFDYLQQLHDSNNQRYNNIHISIIFWYFSFIFVFLVIAFLALYYYIIPGKLSSWFS
jgi:hypothetical protein